MTKIASMLIWNLLSSLVICAAYLVIFGGAEIGYGAVSEIYAELGDSLRALGGELSALWSGYTGSVILVLIYAVLFCIFEILLLYFGISLGCMLTKKHRVISSILCIIGVNIVFSILDNILLSVMAGVGFWNASAASFAVLLSLTVFCLVKVMACYLGTKAILTRKLNLD